MAVEQGNWQLVFTSYNSMASMRENPFPDEIEVLVATNAEDALVEAKAKWDEIQGRGNSVATDHVDTDKPLAYPRAPRLRFEADVSDTLPNPELP